MRKTKNKEINKGILQPFCTVLTHVWTVILPHNVLVSQVSGDKFFYNNKYENKNLAANANIKLTFKHNY